ncbi:uncharacterized protein [Argopecten irradians]|uniref:uncharacterized protein n=1 Tax=Argopecten irradians TaxID=31199 RepID=UPI00371D5B46
MEDDKAVGLIEAKNLLYDKPINVTTAANLKHMRNFPLESSTGQLRLKANNYFYYQCKGLVNIVILPWIDFFFVRTERPYQLHVERIMRDEQLWENVIVPKLKAFYHKAMLPELACPRARLNPWMREPGVLMFLRGKQQ